jgi:hypothetical protein
MELTKGQISAIIAIMGVVVIGTEICVWIGVSPSIPKTPQEIKMDSYLGCLHQSPTVVNLTPQEIQNCQLLSN